MAERPTRTMVEYFWCLKNVHKFYPSICIDAGAGTGTPAIYRAFSDAAHIAIEPIPEQIPALSKALEGLNHTIINAAVLDVPGRRLLRKSTHLLESSMAIPHLATGDTNVIEVEVRTVDTIMEAYVENTGSWLMKTDCQGADLDVLKGAYDTLQRCGVVVVEAPFYRYRGEQQPDFYDIVHFMKQAGFVVHDLIDGIFRPFDRALGQIDIAFVKERGPFRSQQRRWA
jgi:FkbM family methyltransferase